MSADPVDPEILANFDNFRTKKLNYFAKLTSFFCTSVSHSSSSNQRRPRNLAMLDMGCSFCFWMIHFRWNIISIFFSRLGTQCYTMSPAWTGGL